MDTLILAVLGLGGMGRQHARNFAALPGCRIVAGADPAPAARDAFARDFPDVRLSDDPAAAVSDPDTHAVIVCTPTGTHADLCTAALAAGKHVLVEKPMARTVDECRRMNDAAARAGRVLMVAHCRRFDPDWGAFARTYRDGLLGDRILWRSLKTGIVTGRWFMDDRLGGGPMLDGAVHDYDFANDLFGPPRAVQATALQLDPSATAIDTASAVVAYANGCQLLLSWSWSAHGQYLHDALGPRNSFLFGLNGLTAPDGHGGHCLIDRQGNKTLVPFPKQDMYKTEAAHFLDCIAGRAQCLSPGATAITAVAVAQAVLAAARGPGQATVSADP